MTWMTENGKYRLCGALAGTGERHYSAGAAAFRSLVAATTWAKLWRKRRHSPPAWPSSSRCALVSAARVRVGARELSLGDGAPVSRRRASRADWIGGKLFKDVPNTLAAGAFSRCFCSMARVSAIFSGRLSDDGLALCPRSRASARESSRRGASAAGRCFFCCMTLFLGVDQTHGAGHQPPLLPANRGHLAPSRISKNGYLDREP